MATKIPQFFIDMQKAMEEMTKGTPKKRIKAREDYKKAYKSLVAAKKKADEAMSKAKREEAEEADLEQKVTDIWGPPESDPSRRRRRRAVRRKASTRRKASPRRLARRW